jgi:peroxiredoxin-like protein
VKPFPHEYEAHLAGGATGYAMVSTPGIPDLRTAPPADFDGPGDAWSPEHLLLAAVQTCFLFTLRAVARASKLDFVSLDIDATGTVQRQDGITRFTEIVLRPRLVIPPDGSLERARHALEKCERHCLVTASLSTPVRMALEITRTAEGSGAAC